MRPSHFLLSLVIGLVSLISAPAQTASDAPVKIGAYYFDGWTGKTFHITERLKTEFANREPVWGWKDDTVEIMEQQIDLAAKGGLSFWSFCWYWSEAGGHDTDPHNAALGLYLQAKNRSQLQFCLLVANHKGYRIGPKDWPELTKRWIAFFKEPTHLTVDGKPLIIIFSPKELLAAYGTPEAVKAALDQLRADAKAAGLPGVSIAACALPGPLYGWDPIAPYIACGYDLFTGYNYSGAGKKVPNSIEQPFANMIPGHEEIWKSFAERVALPYVPLVTTGWDKRPWEALDLPAAKQSRVYPDRSPALVEEMIRKAIQWVRANPTHTTAEKLILLYAWNENGEGGYLTPTKAEGSAYLDTVLKAQQPVTTP